MASRTTVGGLLREWRQRRRKSQLDLAVEAGVSTRHLSFIETGRAQPSREMVLLLARALDVPLRDRNDLLTSAGFAPVYRATSLEAPALAQVRRALDFILRQQGPPNAMRLMFHPSGFRPYIVNWEATAASLIQWLHRDAVSGRGDDETRRLLDELLAYPDVPRQWRSLDLEASTAPFLPIEFARDGLRLRYFTTLTSLGTPHDITLQELRIESFFPADEATEEASRRLSAG